MSRARLSLDLDVTTKEAWEATRARTGLGSLTDLVKRSIRLYDLVEREQRAGGKLVIRYGDRDERITLL